VHGPAGAGVWTTPVVDPKRRAVYVGTGNSNTPVSTPEANAVVAFAIDTGKRLWSTQVVADDNRCPRGWQGCVSREYDLTGSLLLYVLPSGQRRVLASSKSGEVFAFDPDAKGRLVWTRKTHQASGFSGRWGLALDGTSLYVDSNVLIPGRFAPADAVPGGIVAVDPATGEIRWSTPAPPAQCSWSTPELLKRPMDCNASQQAGLAAIPGAVFAGSADGHVRAYDARTGAVFWNYDTGGSRDAVNGVKAIGGSLSYGAMAVAYGMLFVDSGAAGYHEGNALLAFSVDGK
jgi:polyvinyl alcohol dehydrogenase (cytochrome)